MSTRKEKLKTKVFVPKMPDLARFFKVQNIRLGRGEDSGYSRWEQQCEERVKENWPKIC